MGSRYSPWNSTDGKATSHNTEASLTDQRLSTGCKTFQNVSNSAHDVFGLDTTCFLCYGRCSEGHVCETCHSFIFPSSGIPASHFGGAFCRGLPQQDWPSIANPQQLDSAPIEHSQQFDPLPVGDFHQLEPPPIVNPQELEPTPVVNPQQLDPAPIEQSQQFDPPPIVIPQQVDLPPVEDCHQLEPPPIVHPQELELTPVVRPQQLESPPIEDSHHPDPPPVEDCHQLVPPPIVHPQESEPTPVVSPQQLESPPIDDSHHPDPPPIEDCHQLEPPPIVNPHEFEPTPVVSPQQLEPPPIEDSHHPDPPPVEDCQSETLHIEDLPPEVLQAVFSHLDDLSLWCAGKVCQRWQQVMHIFNRELWRDHTMQRWPLFKPTSTVADWFSVYSRLVTSSPCKTCLFRISDRPRPRGVESGCRVRRLRSELETLRAEPRQGIEAMSLDSNYCHLTATITGPIGSPYEGGIFHLYLQVPLNYPFDPPTVRFTTKIFHPNVSRHGDIGVDCLRHNWCAALTVASVLLSIQSLLTDPCCRPCMEPVVGRMCLDDRKRFETVARDWTRRYAMLDVFTPDKST